MENLEIEIKTGGAYGTHIFVSADIDLTINIAGKEYFGSFQTGHSFDHGDYGYPTNSVSVVDDGGPLEALDGSCGDYDDFIESSELKISEPEFNKSYELLIEARDSAQSEIDAILKAEEEKLNSDRHVYVAVTEREEVENELRQCSPEYSCRFDDDESAEDFIEEMQGSGNFAYKTDTDNGLALNDEHYSNF